MQHADTDNAHDAGVQSEGIPAGFIFRVTAVSTIVMVAVTVIGFQIAQHAFRDSEVARTEVTGYPALRTATEQGLQKISEYGAVAGVEGRFRIPLDRAIDLMVNEAAAARSQASR